jgi:hypothetical protein
MDLMDREPALRHQIRQALDLEFEPAPWLRHRAMETLRHGRMREEKHEDMDTPSRGPRKITPRSLALVATLLGIAVVAGLVAASRSFQPAAHSAARADSQSVYMSAVHEEWGPWQGSINTAWTHCYTAAAELSQAGRCRSDTVQAKALTQRYLDRLAAVNAPTQLRERDQFLRQALSDMLPLLDQRVAAIDRGDLAELESINFQVGRQQVRGVWLAVIAIDCWPKDAVLGATEVSGPHCA